MDAGITAILSLGFVFGLRHALDPDHLVAVSSIVSEHKSIRRSSLIGSFWGLGHTVSLLGIGLLILAMRLSIPTGLLPVLELPVAVMLVALGCMAIRRLMRDRGIRIHTHTHSHGDEPPHAHVHLHARTRHDHRHHLIKLGRRPFIVGMVHGVAGSAAVTLGVLATIPSLAAGVAYIAVFGIGSIGGMVLMSTLISLPFALTARLTVLNNGIRLVAGLFSMAFGLMLALRVTTELLGRG
ncbi:MAG TPA: urease accessory protein UreH [Blastocatellia bacterium]|nr:urease accessory protein UreH [Blastocatellia bacterium]